MHTRTLICAIVAMSFATWGSAIAQGKDRDRNDRGQRAEQRDRHDNNARRDARGAGPNHQFHRGQRLPVAYRHRNYVVNDWRGHHLSAPPRGHHWVQTGSDYVLVAIATGIILQLSLVN